MLKGMLLGPYSLQSSRLSSSSIDDLFIMSAFLAFLFPHKLLHNASCQDCIETQFVMCEKYTHEL